MSNNFYSGTKFDPISHKSTNIAQLAPLGVAHFAVPAPIYDIVVSPEATRYDTANDLRYHSAVDIPKEVNPSIFFIREATLRPHDVTTANSEYRPIDLRLESVRITSRTYPYQTKLSLEGVVSTSTPLESLITKHLITIGQMTEEIVLTDTIKEQALIYVCLNGKNGKKITEATLKDLSNLRSILDNKGMQRINQEIIATTQISTSGVPRTYSAKMPIKAIDVLKDTKEVSDDVITSFQYAGAINYCERLWGASKKAEISFVGTNFYGDSPFMSLVKGAGPGGANTIYEGIVSGANTYMLGTSPFPSLLTTINPSHDSPSSLYATKAARFSVVAGVVRPEGLYMLKFTAPTP